jgi:hypothetical protein
MYLLEHTTLIVRGREGGSSMCNDTLVAGGEDLAIIDLLESTSSRFGDQIVDTG